MPRRSFKFPTFFQDAIKEHVFFKILAINPKRFNQQSQYVSALIHSLEGTVIDDKIGFIKIEATAFDDTDPHSAESISGADFAITAKVSDGVLTIDKAILFQAKLGLIEEFNKSQLMTLKNQVAKMKSFTNSTKVLEIEDYGSVRFPFVISGERILRDLPYKRTRLDRYIVQRILTTFDGDTGSDFVKRVQHSSFAKLYIDAEIKR